MTSKIKISVHDLSFSYPGKSVLRRVSADFTEHTITAVTGPSGQGKSTFLMLLNRLWEDVQGAKMTGSVRIRLENSWKDIYKPGINLPWLRRKVGMVFQAPNPLPMSIEKNIAFPLKLAGWHTRDRGSFNPCIETALRRAYLWEEVKDHLTRDARRLSGGQQQRLCIARALVLEPEVLLLDEPTSSLDDSACREIEELLKHLKKQCTLVMVSHYQDQVKRIADRVLTLSGDGFTETCRN